MPPSFTLFHNGIAKHVLGLILLFLFFLLFILALLLFIIVIVVILVLLVVFILLIVLVLLIVLGLFVVVFVTTLVVLILVFILVAKKVGCVGREGPGNGRRNTGLTRPRRRRPARLPLRPLAIGRLAPRAYPYMTCVLSTHPVPRGGAAEPKKSPGATFPSSLSTATDVRSYLGVRCRQRSRQVPGALAAQTRASPCR